MKQACKLLIFAAASCAALAVHAQAPKPTPTLATPTPSRVVPVDRIVAVVNDEVITLNDLSERVNLVMRQIQRQGGQVPGADVLTRQILERMVNDLVQVQLAKETGIKVDDATLDKTIERIAQENNLAVSAFRGALERDGIRYPRFREDIRSEILLARLREREIDNAVVVTDAEVETEIAREAREASGDSEYNLAHVLVVVQPQSNSQQIEQRRRRALAALSELRRGVNFAQVAATYSDAPDALQGGSLGWRASGRLPQAFLGAVSKLQPGEVSPPVQTPFGWHLVQVVGRRSEELSADRKKIAARQAIRSRKADEAYQDWLRQMRDRAFVENRYDER